MEKKYVLAIDQSTQGTKAVLFGQKGEMICQEALSHEQLINEKGWVSHDLDEIYTNTIQAVKNLVIKSGIAKEEIACLGISNQRETSAAWRKDTGRPLAPAIVWQCARAEEICERIRKNVMIDPMREEENHGGVAEILYDKTGMQLSPYFPAAKYAWLLENDPAVKKAAKEHQLCLGTIDTYLLYRLTNGETYATDYSNASRTQLFNIHDLAWDKEICSWFGIDAAILPEVCDSSHRYGATDMEGFFTAKLPICAMVGDSQGALFGHGCVEKGMVKATYGTGSSVMLNTGTAPVVSAHGLSTSIGWGIGGAITYVLEGNINYTGAIITWLRNDMELIDSPAETQTLAEEANPNDRTYLVPAFSGLGAPYWKPDARAIFYGMSRTTGKRKIVRAALDAIAYQITDIIELMKTEESVTITELFADGGASGNEYLMQFQSDLLGICVDLPKCKEASALGAALLAGICCGFYKEPVFSKDNERKKNPSMHPEERDARYFGWKNAVEKVL